MADIFVRITGNDSYTNNVLHGYIPSLAFSTINRALAVSNPGDNIFIGAGTYFDTITNVTKANISLIADTSGIKTGDKGLVIIKQGITWQFNNCTGDNFTIKNIISISTSGSYYALFLNNPTSKIINCVFAGLGGGASCSGSLYNCTLFGAYIFANNAGVPKEVYNCILIGLNEVAINGSNNYRVLPVDTDIFVDSANYDFRVKEQYLANVKEKGILSPNIPIEDIIGMPRGASPWIGAYDDDVSIECKILEITPTHLYSHQHANCIIKASATLLGEPRDFKVSVNNIEVSPLGSELIRVIPISIFSIDSNIIKIESENSVSQSTITKEQSYRTNAHRTFLATDGGYIKNNITTSANIVKPTTVYKGNTTTLNNNITTVILDKFVNKIEVK